MIHPYFKRQKQGGECCAPQISSPQGKKHTGNYRRKEGYGVSLAGMTGLDIDEVIRGKGKGDGSQCSNPWLYPHHVKQEIGSDKIKKNGIDRIGKYGPEKAHDMGTDIFWIGNPYLIRRHSPEHGIGPQRALAVLVFKLHDFPLHCLGLNDVVLHQGFSLPGRGEINKADGYKNSNDGKVDGVAGKPVFHSMISKSKNSKI